MLNRRQFLAQALAAGASVLAGCATTGSGGPGAAKRPNIVFIMTDDQGPWAWGYGGHPDARTPNIDRLREQGAMLSHHFVASPVCSASRASLLSSRYPSETGILGYLSPSIGDNVGLDPALPTWPRLLDAAGYRTGMFGKWHVGTGDPFLPKNFGYDEFIGWRQGAEVSIDPRTEIDGAERVVKGYTQDVITDFAIGFLEQDTDEPFMMCLHYFAPHANTENNSPDNDRTWLPLSDTDWAPFKEKAITLPEPQHPKLEVPRAVRMTREYLASVASADRNVGRVLDTLDRLGLADNTVVVFTSDNGFNMGHHGIWHKGNGRWLLIDNRGDCPNIWDNSLQVPAVVRWPGHIRPGSTIEQTTSHLDWFPTLLAMAGVPLPQGAVLRGHDFSPLLEGQSVPWNNEYFAQYQPWPSQGENVNLRTYRTPEWKLIRDFTRSDCDELYHLSADPKELSNLIHSNDPEAIRMRDVLDKKMLKAMADINDPSLPKPSG